MIVIAPLPTSEFEKTMPASAAGDAGDAARELAAGFLRYASSCWRGDACAAVFPLRLSAYWRPSLSPAPAAATPPAKGSP